MPTIMIFHEVDDVAHWVASPKRGEAFASVGATHRTFVDPEDPNRVGIVAEVPNMDACNGSDARQFASMIGLFA